MVSCYQHTCHLYPEPIRPNEPHPEKLRPRQYQDGDGQQLSFVYNTYTFFFFFGGR